MDFEICKTRGCIREVSNYGYGYCSKHYKQIMKFGITKRTKFDKNEIFKFDGYAEIVLYNGKGREVARTKIDIEDIKKVKGYKWCLNSYGYAQANIDGKVTRLHKLIIENSINGVIDHINRDKLDNRKSNLRICTRQENNYNRNILPSNKSGITGVCFNKKNNKWSSVIKKDGKRIILGNYENKEDAIITRLKAEKEYFGEFAPQINLFEKYNI